MGDPKNAASESKSYFAWLHRFAVLTAMAVFPLIIVGAGVTSQDAGMAFPDWPTSNGHLVNPPGWWEMTATRWEHGHRLIGWVVGMLATTTVLLGVRRRGAVRFFCLATFLAIGIQGVLGGLRVTQVSTSLAMVHGIWGQLCFCLAATSALVTSRTWLSSSASIDMEEARQFKRLSMITSSVVFLQLVLGAALRHFGSKSALLGHALWAVIVAMLVLWLAMWAMKDCAAQRVVVRTAKLMAGLIVLQLLLGSFALFTTFPGVVNSPFVLWAIPSAHVAVGATILASTLLLTLMAHRFVRVNGFDDGSVVATNLASS